MDKLELSLEELNDVNNFMLDKYDTNPNNDLAMEEFELIVKKFQMKIISIMADTRTIYKFDKDNLKLIVKNIKRFYSKDKTHIELTHLEFHYDNKWVFDKDKFNVTFDGKESERYTKDYFEPMYLDSPNPKEIHAHELYVEEFFYLNKFMMDYRPIITIEDKEEHIPNQSKKKHKKYKKNKPSYRVNLYKVIHIKKDWQNEVKKHIEYVCRAWRVRGHYRTYKSGKVVYVHPYTKGKERDNLLNITDKTYYIMKGIE